MSRENVELVRGIQPGPEVDVAATFRDEHTFPQLVEAVRPLFHPDFEVVTTTPLDHRHYSGFDGMRTAWLDWLEPWETYRTEIKEFIDAGDEVLLLLRDYGRRAGMQAEVSVLGASVWTVLGGKVARVEFFSDRAEALEAVGLRE